MKITKTIMAVAFVAMAVASRALVLTETVDGITWTYEVSDGTAIIGHNSSKGLRLLLAPMPFLLPLPVPLRYHRD